MHEFPFRTDELVWYVLPHSLPHQQDPSLRITHWPARVNDRILSSRNKFDRNVSSADPFAAPTIQTEPYYRYLVDLLATTSEVVCENKQLTPWLVWPIDNRLSAGEQTNSISLYHTIPSIKSLIDYETAFAPWTYARLWGQHIAETYCAMGMYFPTNVKAAYKPSKEGIPRHIYLRRKKRAQDEQRKLQQCFQALWWSAEKIWVGEMVRLAGIWDQANDGAVRIKLVFCEKDQNKSSTSSPPRALIVKDAMLNYQSHGRPAFFKINTLYRDPKTQDMCLAGHFYELLPAEIEKGKNTEKRKEKILASEFKKGSTKYREHFETCHLPPPRTGKVFKRLEYYTGSGQGESHISVVWIAG